MAGFTISDVLCALMHRIFRFIIAGRLLGVFCNFDCVSSHGRDCCSDTAPGKFQACFKGDIIVGND